MAAADQSKTLPMPEKAHLLIIEARFYDGLADALLEGAKAALDAAGATYDVVTVPGALEIPAAISFATTPLRAVLRLGSNSRRCLITPASLN